MHFFNGAFICLSCVMMLHALSGKNLTYVYFLNAARIMLLLQFVFVLFFVVFFSLN